MEEEGKKISDKINEIDWRNFVTWTTIVSITMIAFYGLGALKHFKEIKKLG